MNISQIDSKKLFKSKLLNDQKHADNLLLF